MTKLKNVTLTVKDVDEAKKFFLDLGMKVDVDWTVPPETEPGTEEPTGIRRLCMLKDDHGFGVELCEFDKEYPYNKGVGLTFQVENLEDEWDALKDKPGVKQVVYPGQFPMEEFTRTFGLPGAFFVVDVDLGRIDGETQVVEVLHLAKPDKDN